MRNLPLLLLLLALSLELSSYIGSFFGSIFCVCIGQLLWWSFFYTLIGSQSGELLREMFCFCCVVICVYHSYLSVFSGAVYMWGQNKNTGDATMYPKPIHDLSGWNIRSIGCWYGLLWSFFALIYDYCNYFYGCFFRQTSRPATYHIIDKGVWEAHI